MRLIVGDGLGHGPVAATASRKAVGVFAEGGAYPLPVLLEMMHEALAGTRGAAVAIAEIDASAGRVSYVGVGDFAAGIVQHEKTTSLVSHNGTVGAQIRKVQEFSYPWTPVATFVMHSDGVKAHWQIDRYLGLAQRHPSLIAGVIYRDYLRINDDATVASEPSPKAIRLLLMEIGLEHDVVLCRQRARQLAASLGFEPQAQIRVATALSEIARNAFQYAGGGRVEFLWQTEPRIAASRSPRQSLVIVVRDSGSGVAGLEEILAGRYRSKTGLGLGILGAHRLMDRV